MTAYVVVILLNNASEEIEAFSDIKRIISSFERPHINFQDNMIDMLTKNSKMPGLCDIIIKDPSGATA